MKKTLFLILICINIAFSKSINIQLQNNSNQDIIVPDKIVLTDNNSGMEYHLEMGDIDFDYIMGLKDDNIKFNDEFFPNPCSDQANCNVTISTGGYYDLSISDISGKEIYSKSEHLSKGMNSISMNLSGFSTGNYFLTIKNENSINSVSFIVNSLSQKEPDINLSVFNSGNTPKLNDETSYTAKIYASGYEPIETELNPADYDDNETVTFGLEEYDFSKFDTAKIDFKLLFSQCYMHKIIYEYGQLVYDEFETIDRKGAIVHKSDYVFNHENPEDNQFTFYKKDNGKWGIISSFKFQEKNARAKFRFGFFYIEDDKITIYYDNDNYIQDVISDLGYTEYEEESYGDTEIEITYEYGHGNFDTHGSHCKLVIE